MRKSPQPHTIKSTRLFCSWNWTVVALGHEKINDPRATFTIITHRFYFLFVVVNIMSVYTKVISK